MTHEELVYAALSAYSGLENASIAINSAPQDAVYPFIVLTLVSAYGEHSYSLRGPSISQTRWQIDVYSNMASQAIQLAEIVRTCIYESFKGVCMNKSNSFEKETRAHRTMLEFSIWL